MYNVLKLAALSAALAAAVVALTDNSPKAPSAAKFLTDRLQTEVAPAPAARSTTGGMVAPASGCAGAAWPYREACASAQATARPVRVISPDRREPSRMAGDSVHAQIAQR